MRTVLLIAMIALAAAAEAAAAPASLPPLKASGSVTASCESSMRGIGIPLAQMPTKSVSTFGIFEFTPDHRDLRRHGNSLLRDKAPVGIRGDTTVVVSVPDRMRHRIALSYGVPGSRGRYAEIQFQPCPHKARTAWPGGLILRDRRPVKLLVAVGDRPPRPLWLGRKSI